MMTRTTIAIAVALQFLAVPAMAQGTSGNESNAHHYQGGPKTVVPHSNKHPQPSNVKAKAPTAAGQHHYSGGPKTEPHHIGEKK
jgi:hypothetical protein